MAICEDEFKAVEIKPAWRGPEMDKLTAGKMAASVKNVGVVEVASGGGGGLGEGGRLATVHFYREQNKGNGLELQEGCSLGKRKRVRSQAR